MRSKLFITALLVLLFTAASTADIGEGVLQTAKTEFNQAPVPDVLGSVIGDQTINTEIEKENSTEKIGVKMSGVKIGKAKTEHFENSTLEAEVEMETVEDIASSDRPVKELNRKVQSGDIDYEAHGAVNSFKFFVAEKLLALGSLF